MNTKIVRSILTDEQKHEVMGALYSNTYDEIFDIVVENKWTKEMFVYFCRELYRDGEASASNEACL